MSRPVIIRNGNKTIKNVKDKTTKTVMLGNQYHICLRSLDVPVFTLSSEEPGGLVTYKNKLFGIVVVPQSITGDNSIRIMSAPLMSGLHPTTGSYSKSAKGNENMINTGFLYRSGLKAYSYDDNLYNILSYHFYANSPSTVSSSNFYDGFATHRVWLQLTDSINNFPNWRTATEYLQSALNQAGPDVSASYHGSRQERGYSEGNMCCWRFSPVPDIDTTGYWYIPSYMELRCEYLYKSSIATAYQQIYSLYNLGYGNLILPGNGYRTSDYNNGSYSDWGGSCGKYIVLSGNYYSSSIAIVDPNLVQAFCKLIKNNGKWILDPTYHID